MIAMSDAVIILVSASALSTGIYRWQNNNHHEALAVSAPSVSSNVQSSAVEPVNNINAIASTATSTGSAVNATRGNIRPSVTAVNTADGTTNTETSAATVPSAPAASSNDAASPLYGIYTVRSGDSLSLIAQRYGSTVANLQDINDISGTLIIVGQEIRYPLPAN